LKGFLFLRISVRDLLESLKKFCLSLREFGTLYAQYYVRDKALTEFFLFPEYRIPGTPAPDGSCTFTYRSESKKQGEFNSPRYPSNYPAHTNCTYLFNATPNEQVTLVFDHFKVRADRANSTTGSYG